jgi:hypothetical protein
MLTPECLFLKDKGLVAMQLLLRTYSISFSQLCKVNLKTMIKKYRTELIGISIGTLGGFAYWYFVGCESGTCAITSSPLNSSVYGAIMGALLAGIVVPEKKKEVNEQKK